MSEKDKKLKKIPSSRFARGMSFLNLTVNSSVKFIGHKVTGSVQSKVTQDGRINKLMIDQAQLFVKELGKLKGSAMKVGQLLSQYGEHFFPKEVNEILRKLHADSTPVSWATMEKQIRRQLGADVFSSLDITKEPIGAASIGQVYKAREKPGGRILALKVQYPGVDKAIDSDLNMIKSFMSFAKLIPRGPSFDDIYKEIRMMLHHEADYNRELKLILDMKERLREDDRYIVPNAYENYSSKRILCMSFEEGVALESEEVTVLPQEVRNRLGVSVMNLMLQEIFEWRLVQTDAHFGNFKVNLDEGAKLVLLDHGAYRKFPKEYVTNFANLIYSSLICDSAGVIIAAEKLGFMMPNDTEEQRDLFYKLCMKAVSPFALQADKEYDWGSESLFAESIELAKNAVFTFKFRSPPRESVFMNRKLMGTYFILQKLGTQYNGRELLLKYLEPYIAD